MSIAYHDTLVIIEDTAQAHDAEYKDRRLGMRITSPSRGIGPLAHLQGRVSNAPDLAGRKFALVQVRNRGCCIDVRN